MAHNLVTGGGSTCGECRERMAQALDEANPAHPRHTGRRVTPRTMSGIMAGHTRAVKAEQRRLGRLMLEYEAGCATTRWERKRSADDLELFEFESQRCYFNATLDRAYTRYCSAGFDRAVARYLPATLCAGESE